MPPTRTTGTLLRTTTTRTTLTLLSHSSHIPTEHVTIEEVFDAYFDCRKHKRRTGSAIKFEMNYISELNRLHEELNNQTYKIGKSIAFCVTLPKLREVFAADFRDRIVHHLIVNKFGAIFEAEMLDCSYACRKGKGTLYGARDLQKKMREVGGGGWYARCDIQGFFMSIDRGILYNEVERILRKNNVEDIDWWLWLIRLVIINRPERNCEIHGERKLWNRLPKNKSLFHSNGIGLPIGNLTSQIFANLYMSMFDRWITSQLGEEGRLSRYVDDFIIMHPNKEVATRLARQSRGWLRDNLHITMHPKKVCIQQIRRGTRFVGVYVRSNIILPSRRLIEGTDKLIEESPQLPTSKVVGRMNSRIGLMVHYQSYRLRRRMWRKLADRNEERFININNKKIKERIKYETIHYDLCANR